MSSDYQSSQSEQEIEVEAKPTKKQITEAQRRARLENLRKGRETRLNNLQNKKTKAKEKKVEIYESSSSESETDTNSDSSEEEIHFVTKPKRKNKPDRLDFPKKDTRNDEIAELKAIVAKLAKDKKKKQKSKKTIINVQAQPQMQTTSNSKADFYKHQILKL